MFGVTKKLAAELLLLVRQTNNRMAEIERSFAATQGQLNAHQIDLNMVIEVINRHQDQLNRMSPPSKTFTAPRYMYGPNEFPPDNSGPIPAPEIIERITNERHEWPDVAEVQQDLFTNHNHD